MLPVLRHFVAKIWGLVRGGLGLLEFQNKEDSQTTFSVTSEVGHQHALSFFEATKDKFSVEASDFFYRLNISKYKSVGVFGPPKTSTLFFYNCIADLMALEKTTVFSMDSQGYYMSDMLNEIDSIKIFERGLQKEFITHAHVIANPHTLRVISQTGMDVLITFRNIPDSLVSLRGELERQWKQRQELITKQGYVSTFFGQAPAHAINHFLSASHEIQMDFLIEATTAWYAFHAHSWEQALESGKHSIYAIHYDNVVLDDAGEVYKFYQFLGGTLPESDVRTRVAALKRDNKEALNINAGVSGARKLGLTSAQKERIRTILITVSDEKFADKHSTE